MATYVSPSAFLDDQFPARYRALLPPALKQAYAAANALANDSPILQVQSARWNRGRLRAWATDLAIERLIQSGALPFDCDWASYHKPTGKYLRVRLESSVLSVSLVQSHKRPPRRVVFRTNDALGNPQMELFQRKDTEFKIEGLPGFVMVHGPRKPEFLRIGMPAPNSKHWGYISNNIMLSPHEVTSTGIPGDLAELPAEEAVDEEAMLSLKDQLERWRRDNENG